MELEFFFDYACPYCYLGFHYLKALIARYPDVEIIWRPCEAHPYPEERKIIEETPSWWEKLKPQAAERNVVLNLPHSPAPHSHLAIQGLFFMLEQGADIWRYSEQVYEAVFINAQDIENIDVLVACVADLNVEEAAFRRVLENKIYERVQHEFNVYAYEKNSIWAVPAFILGEERLDAAEGIGITENDLALFLREAHDAY